MHDSSFRNLPTEVCHRAALNIHSSLVGFHSESRVCEFYSNGLLSFDFTVHTSSWLSVSKYSVLDRNHMERCDRLFGAEWMLHGIGGISAPCHAMPLLLANMPFHVNYLVE
jgi:hypothetical protein